MLLTLAASIQDYLRAGAAGASGLCSQRLQQPLQGAQHQACCMFPTKLLCSPTGIPGAAWAAMTSCLHKAVESSPCTGSLTFRLTEPYPMPFNCLRSSSFSRGSGWSVCCFSPWKLRSVNSFRDLLVAYQQAGMDINLCCYWIKIPTVQRLRYKFL